MRIRRSARRRETEFCGLRLAGEFRRRTATGWKRANALVGLFDPAGGTSPRLPLAKPTRLFASGSESLRPVQTITPLAAALGNLPINTAYRKNQLDKLVAAAKNGEGASLIAWQHEDIPAIAALEFWAAPAASRRNGPAAVRSSSGCSTGRTRQSEKPRHSRAAGLELGDHSIRVAPDQAESRG